eukprot:TRINITY_DN68909_c0_g1_i1.p1 TRINITY_DN68909_c0_g1~~TRINITY_DN68909_c0_g1_i1.p1  ORF type:complete len:1039 (-),score=155.74 TRINITY_DN68909_c0_g1_i1:120-3128(-)
MPCLSGVAGLASTGCANYDLPGFVTGSFFGVRANTVGQTFSRRFSAIDYKLQRQALHREDIRDLIELTTARMDIYHIVGTLVLTFCIGWYTDNLILDASLPIWYSDMFYISNFAAVGYLILCVWLSMYASIAARSIGTRLLTSYSRLSLPTRKELDDIKNPIFFNTMDIIRRQQERRRRSGTSASPGDGTVETANDMESSGSQKEKDDGDKFDHQEDDEQHFRRLLGEMPRWLHYDVWSRVCMCLGMNQMLQALAYFILGVIWQKSPMSGIMSFLAVKILGYIVLWLDIGDMTTRARDRFALALLNFFPPVLATVVLFNATISDETGKVFLERFSVLSSLCFWAHAGWLLYLNEIFRRPAAKDSRFKPVEFATVLEWVDYKEVPRNEVADVEIACRSLEKEMAAVIERETERKSVDVSARTSSCLVEMCKQLRKNTSHLHDRVSHPQEEAAMKRGEQVASRFDLWSEAGNLLAEADALKSAPVRERLADAEVALVDELFESFLKRCLSLGLGICSGRPHIGQSLAAHTIESAGRRVVRCGADGFIDVASGEQLKEAPKGRWLQAGARTIVLHDFVLAVQRWIGVADDFKQKPKACVHLTFLPGETAVPQDDLLSINGGLEPGKWKNTASKTALASSNDWLPARAFRYFTIACISWWIVAGFAHGIANVFLGPRSSFHGFIGPERIETVENAEVQNLKMEWPAPEHLFKVSSLHCGKDTAWLSNNFSLYETAASVSRKGAGSLKHIKRGDVAAVFCGNGGCDSLSRPPLASGGDGTLWHLAPLGTSRTNVTLVPIPPSWRLVTGTWTQPCSTSVAGRSACNAGRLVGWDGAQIVVATLQRSVASEPWEVNTEFEMDPSVGLCPESEGFGCKFGSPSKYTKVISLQLGEDGQELTVLLDHGVFDAWDIAEGVVRGRWRLGEDFTSMCHNRNGMLLSRRDKAGPRLVTVPLPTRLGDLYYPEQPVLLQHRGRNHIETGRVGSALRGRSRRSYSDGDVLSSPSFER